MDSMISQHFMGVIRDSYLGTLRPTVRFEIFPVFFCWDPPVRFPPASIGLNEGKG